MGKSRKVQIVDAGDAVEEAVPAGMEVEIEFESVPPTPEDFHGLKTILSSNFGQLKLDLSSVADEIIERSNLSQCAGVGSFVVSLGKHCQSAGEPLKSIWDRKNELKVGWIINERLGLPPTIATPLLETFLKDWENLKSRDPKLNFSHFIMVCSVFRVGGAQGEDFWCNAEEMYLAKVAEASFDIPKEDDRNFIARSYKMSERITAFPMSEDHATVLRNLEMMKVEGRCPISTPARGRGLLMDVNVAKDRGAVSAKRADLHSFGPKKVIKVDEATNFESSTRKKIEAVDESFPVLKTSPDYFVDILGSDLTINAEKMEVMSNWMSHCRVRDGGDDFQFETFDVMLPPVEEANRIGEIRQSPELQKRQGRDWKVLRASNGYWILGGSCVKNVGESFRNTFTIDFQDYFIEKVSVRDFKLLAFNTHRNCAVVGLSIGSKKGVIVIIELLQASWCVRAWVEVPFLVLCLEYFRENPAITELGESSQETTTKRQRREESEGYLVIGSEGGRFYLMNTIMSGERMSIERVERTRLHRILDVRSLPKDESALSHITSASVPSAIAFNEENSDGSVFEVFGPNESFIESVLYCESEITGLRCFPTIRSIAVGYRYGGFELWNMDTLQLEYASASESVNGVEKLDIDSPVIGFELLEPENDPENTACLFVLRSEHQLLSYGEVSLGESAWVTAFLIKFAKIIPVDGATSYQGMKQPHHMLDIDLLEKISLLPKSQFCSRIVSHHSLNLAQQKNNGLLLVSFESWARGDEPITAFSAPASREVHSFVFGVDQWYEKQLTNIIQDVDFDHPTACHFIRSLDLTQICPDIAGDNSTLLAVFPHPYKSWKRYEVDFPNEGYNAVSGIDIMLEVFHGTCVSSVRVPAFQWATWHLVESSSKRDVLSNPFSFLSILNSAGMVPPTEQECVRRPPSNESEANKQRLLIMYAGFENQGEDWLKQVCYYIWGTEENDKLGEWPVRPALAHTFLNGSFATCAHVLRNICRDLYFPVGNPAAFDQKNLVVLAFCLRVLEVVRDSARTIAKLEYENIRVFMDYKWENEAYQFSKMRDEDFNARIDEIFPLDKTVESCAVDFDGLSGWLGLYNSARMMLKHTALLHCLLKHGVLPEKCSDSVVPVGIDGIEVPFQTLQSLNAKLRSMKPDCTRLIIDGLTELLPEECQKIWRDAHKDAKVHGERSYLYPPTRVIPLLEIYRCNTAGFEVMDAILYYFVLDCENAAPQHEKRKWSSIRQDLLVILDTKVTASVSSYHALDHVVGHGVPGSAFFRNHGDITMSQLIPVNVENLSMICEASGKPVEVLLNTVLRSLVLFPEALVEIAEQAQKWFTKLWQLELVFHALLKNRMNDVAVNLLYSNVVRRFSIDIQRRLHRLVFDAIYDAEGLQGILRVNFWLYDIKELRSWASTRNSFWKLFSKCKPREQLEKRFRKIGAPPDKESTEKSLSSKASRGFPDIFLLRPTFEDFRKHGCSIVRRVGKINPYIALFARVNSSYPLALKPHFEPILVDRTFTEKALNGVLPVPPGILKSCISSKRDGSRRIRWDSERQPEDSPVERSFPHIEERNRMTISSGVSNESLDTISMTATEHSDEDMEEDESEVSGSKQSIPAFEEDHVFSFDNPINVVICCSLEEDFVVVQEPSSEDSLKIDIADPDASPAYPVSQNINEVSGGEVDVDPVLDSSEAPFDDASLEIVTKQKESELDEASVLSLAGSSEDECDQDETEEHEDLYSSMIEGVGGYPMGGVEISLDSNLVGIDTNRRMGNTMISDLSEEFFVDQPNIYDDMIPPPSAVDSDDGGIQLSPLNLIPEETDFQSEDKEFHEEQEDESVSNASSGGSEVGTEQECVAEDSNNNQNADDSSNLNFDLEGSVDDNNSDTENHEMNSKNADESWSSPSRDADEKSNSPVVQEENATLDESVIEILSSDEGETSSSHESGKDSRDPNKDSSVSNKTSDDDVEEVENSSASDSNTGEDGPSSAEDEECVEEEASFVSVPEREHNSSAEKHDLRFSADSYDSVSEESDDVCTAENNNEIDEVSEISNKDREDLAESQVKSPSPAHEKMNGKSTDSSPNGVELRKNVDRVTETEVTVDDHPEKMQVNGVRRRSVEKEPSAGSEVTEDENSRDSSSRKRSTSRFETPSPTSKRKKRLSLADSEIIAQGEDLPDGPIGSRTRSAIRRLHGDALAHAAQDETDVDVFGLHRVPDCGEGYKKASSIRSRCIYSPREKIIRSAQVMPQYPSNARWGVPNQQLPQPVHPGHGGPPPPPNTAMGPPPPMSSYPNPGYQQFANAPRPMQPGMSGPAAPPPQHSMGLDAATNMMGSLSVNTYPQPRMDMQSHVNGYSQPLPPSGISPNIDSYQSRVGGGMPPPPMDPSQQYQTRPDYANGPPGLAQPMPNVQQGYMPPNYGLAPQPQPQRKLDPDQMPNPIEVMEEDKSKRSGPFVTGNRGQVPPLVTTAFTVMDQGHASPRFIRSTLYAIPATPDLQKQTSVPIAVHISPFAALAEGEVEPPMSDLGGLPPPRCNRCKAYMCPFMQFIDGGRRFSCPFCKATTEVPTEYFQHLDHSGQRLDKYQRPELCLGAYEFTATVEYCKNNEAPKPPAFIFVIDVSYNNVRSGLVPLLCSKLKELLDEFRKKGTTEDGSAFPRVGFITYNHVVHFYNCKESIAAPQMMVVGDVADMFMPLLDGFLVDIEASAHSIDMLLDQIPVMFGETRETETLIGPAIQAGMQALVAHNCAGKLFVFHSSLPIAEAPGKLKNRDDRKLLGSDNEKKILTPQTTFYNNLGQECVAAGCSVDLFLFNNAYVDVATLGQIARLTGGQVNKYTYFQADLDGERVIWDLRRALNRKIAFDCVMRVRTSTGIRPVDFFGNYFMANTTDVELAAVDSDKSICVELKHDDKLTDEEVVYLQAAVLFTSIGGQRKLRIINQSYAVGTQMADVYRAAELDAIMSYLAKSSISRVCESSPKQSREKLFARCAQILACYRKNVASPTSPGQLILPEQMKLLPLYINCLSRSDALTGGPDLLTDDRAYFMQCVQSMDVLALSVFLYPRLYPVHELLMMGEFDLNAPLPMPMRCSRDKMAPNGLYLIVNGIYMLMWIGNELSPEVIMDVFGVNSVAQIDTERSLLIRRENERSIALCHIVDTIQERSPRSMRLRMVRHNDKMERVFMNFLVEDRGLAGAASYVDFLCHIHKEIRVVAIRIHSIHPTTTMTTGLKTTLITATGIRAGEIREKIIGTDEVRRLSLVLESRDILVSHLRQTLEERDDMADQMPCDSKVSLTGSRDAILDSTSIEGAEVLACLYAYEFRDRSRGLQTDFTQDFAADEMQDASQYQTNGSKADSQDDAMEGSGDSNPAREDERKLFIGGLSWETTDHDLKEYFSKYGEIESVNVKTDPNTGRSRGFAFIIFKTVEPVEKVLSTAEHTIGKKRVEAKRAKARQGKIFVGGLPPEVPEEDIREFFGKYGKVVEVEMPFDKVKNQRKGFCFITYDSEEIVKEILKNPKQTIGGKEVDVKKATPRADPMGFSRGGPQAGMRGRGGPPRGARGGRGGWGGQFWGGDYDNYSGGYDCSGMEDELPYRAEYAKSGRASCKKCNTKIDKDDLRLAVMARSARFDGMQAHWFHMDCFFPRKAGMKTEEIAHFEQLRWEDQERIRKRLEAGGDAPSSAKGKKGKGKAAAGGLNDFCVEYAKSGRAKCVACTEPLAKDEVRLGKKDYDSETALRFGPTFRWYHILCFKANREELGYTEAADKLPGFKTLKAEDRDNLKTQLPQMKAQKRKAEDSGDVPDAPASKTSKNEASEKLEHVKKKQNKLLFQCRDNLEKLSKNQLTMLFEYNHLSVPSGVQTMLDILADHLAFGVPENCPFCSNGQLVFRSGIGYSCKGHLSEWSKCSGTFDDPSKQPMKIPEELKNVNSFLATFKPKVRTRAFTKATELSASSHQNGNSQSELFNPRKPLINWKVLMVGKFPDKKETKNTVVGMGAEITSKLDTAVTVLISTKDYFDKTGSKIKEAESKGVPVLNETFIAACQEKLLPPLEFYKEHLLSTWDADLQARISAVEPALKSGSIKKSSSKYVKSEKTQKLKLKGGAAVDPDSKLDHKAHVYRSGNDLYSAVLGKTDISTGQNSFYKLQLLEADSGHHYWVFRAWGRIGTTIGGNKVDDFGSSLDDALELFTMHYEEKSGNSWRNHKAFQKVPGKMAPLEMHDGDDVDAPALPTTHSTTLKQEVENLIRLIFDVKKMREAMLEFELDLQKMPLGKLSKNQIKNAYAVLSNALLVLALPDSDSTRKAKIVDCSNRFYTMIPHDFGVDNPPPLDSEAIIQAKTEMLDNLLEIEIAYQMVSNAENTVDDYYKQLQTDLKVVDETDEIYKTICKYVDQTHAATHATYKLKVKSIFSISRQGEAKRFKPFKDLHNRQLLWHGSRLTNYAGILKQGLRIAPPEAPVTGYMFGKGIYFADMVSKSANYCFSTRKNPTGLLLLSEVALGDMHELKNAKDIVRPPKGKHSVKGIGGTAPDPKENVVLKDGVVVPLGKPKEMKAAQSSLLYNEFIVYDVAQVQIRYLVQTEFVYT
ncbi:unnamed protein product [Notodromas monacha]|uniref:Poly [ADP-ribose] polymerase n=1 Tax=Notodromas monacha TaxID=399045 RepID=A0A7R9BP73_9CRUS|nr:unnamed protein product [Notodromas monacha]CAG0918266.1 unnamed protein product [Notodromas monacha]